MGRSIKLVLYYFAYQLLFLYLVGLIKTVIEWTATGELDFSATQSTIATAGIAMILSGIAMIWHLIHFNYVKFNKASWTEVPVRTILLSIPFIVAAMFTFNIASEFIELPNIMAVSYTHLTLPTNKTV